MEVLGVIAAVAACTVMFALLVAVTMMVISLAVEMWRDTF